MSLEKNKNKKSSLSINFMSIYVVDTSGALIQNHFLDPALELSSLATLELYFQSKETLRDFIKKIHFIKRHYEANVCTIYMPSEVNLG